MEVDPAPAQQLGNGAEEGAGLERKSNGLRAMMQNGLL